MPVRPAHSHAMAPPWAALAIVLVALIAVTSCTHPAATVVLPGGSGRGLVMTVTHVVDGDTVDVRGADGGTERARLLGIDTPETVKPNTPVQCFGPEASARVKTLLPPGTRVAVQRDTEARDRYGRLLLYVWRQSDGLFVNASLVSDGFARILSIEPNTAHRRDLGARAAAARDHRLGLWGRCGIGTGTSTPRPSR